MTVPRMLLCPVLLSAAAILFAAPTAAQQKTPGKNAPAEKGGKTPPAADAKKGPAAQVRTTGQDGVQEIVLPTVDGWGLHATWYPATGGRESPVVILLTSTDVPKTKTRETAASGSPSARSCIRRASR